MQAAQVGRTHGSTRPRRQKHHIALASRGPSTQGSKIEACYYFSVSLWCRESRAFKQIHIRWQIGLAACPPLLDLALHGGAITRANPTDDLPDYGGRNAVPFCQICYCIFNSGFEHRVSDHRCRLASSHHLHPECQPVRGKPTSSPTHAGDADMEPLNKPPIRT